jgi:hypothetical protein
VQQLFPDPFTVPMTARTMSRAVMDMNELTQNLDAYLINHKSAPAVVYHRISSVETGQNGHVQLSPIEHTPDRANIRNAINRNSREEP